MSKTGVRILGVIAGIALLTVILAPIVLSSSDLIRWAASPEGLGVGRAWGILVFISLDAAAAVCILMVTFCAMRGESATSFQILTWLFALGSAYANYRHGILTPAKDDEFFFPAMSIAGPLLLEFVLMRIRKWIRIEEGTQLSVKPRFGKRWLVAFPSTFRAWAVAHREGIASPDDALQFVREVDALKGMVGIECVHYAFNALGSCDPYRARSWLAARSVTATHADIVSAAQDGSYALPEGGPLPVVPHVLPPVPELSGLSKRDAIRYAFKHMGKIDGPAAVTWLSQHGINVDRADAGRVAKTESAKKPINGSPVLTVSGV
jgi:hypothetical protein